MTIDLDECFEPCDMAVLGGCDALHVLAEECDSRCCDFGGALGGKSGTVSCMADIRQVGSSAQDRARRSRRFHHSSIAQEIIFKDQTACSLICFQENQRPAPLLKMQDRRSFFVA